MEKGGRPRVKCLWQLHVLNFLREFLAHLEVPSNTLLLTIGQKWAVWLFLVARGGDYCNWPPCLKGRKNEIRLISKKRGEVIEKVTISIYHRSLNRRFPLELEV